MHRGRPFALERLLESRLNQTLPEYFIVIVNGDDLHDLRADKLVAVSPVFDFLVQLLPHIFHVRSVIRSKQVEHQRARHLHALALETVAVGGLLHLHDHQQHPVHHVSQEIRLCPEIQFANLRQEVVHENVLHLRHRFFLGHCGDELQGGGLCEHLARVVHARNECVNHGRIGV